MMKQKNVVKSLLRLKSVEYFYPRAIYLQLAYFFIPNSSPTYFTIFKSNNLVSFPQFYTQKNSSLTLYTQTTITILYVAYILKK